MRPTKSEPESLIAIGATTESQRKAARVAGFTYLFLNATGIFGESVVRGKLVNYDDAAATARNIVSHEQLFRLGIASELITSISTVVLLTALYIILKPVNRSLALLGTLWRLIEVSIFVGLALNSLDALRVLSGATYLHTFQPDQLQGLARLSLGTHGPGYTVAFVFLGLGTAVFSYLWFKSNYIPQALAGWGVISGLLMGAACFVLIVSPTLSKVLYPGYMIPMGIYEIVIGFWLLFKGLRPSQVSPEMSAE